MQTLRFYALEDFSDTLTEQGVATVYGYRQQNAIVYQCLLTDGLIAEISIDKPQKHRVLRDLLKNYDIPLRRARFVGAA